MTEKVTENSSEEGGNQVSELLEEMGAYADSSDEEVEEPCPNRLKTHQSERM